MAGLGLADAVRGYQQGVQWKQGQDELARQQQMRAQVDAANKAATDVIQQSQSEWAASGAPGQYRPNSQTIFKALEARGSALAKAGLWDQFMEHEAKVAPMKIKARTEALQQYEVDGDADKLARSVYPTLFDGKSIVGSEMIEGADAVQGLPARPSKLKVKLSDGSEKTIDPQEFVGNLKKSLIDPVTAAKNEAILNLERAKAEIGANKQIKVEGFKAKNAQELEGIKAKDRAALAEANNQAAGQRTEATTSATRYSADQRVKAAGLSAARSGSGAPRGDDGLTPTERTNQQRAESVDRRAAISDLSKQLTETRKLLADERDPEAKKELQAEIAQIKKDLDAARNDRKAPRSGGLSDASPKAGDPLETARAEAVSTKSPAQFDLGGRRGTIAANGGLSDAAPAKSAKPAKSEGQAPRDPAQRKAGAIYTTPKGDLIWTGKGWKRVDG